MPDSEQSQRRTSINSSKAKSDANSMYSIFSKALISARGGPQCLEHVWVKYGGESFDASVSGNHKVGLCLGLSMIWFWSAPTNSSSDCGGFGFSIIANRFEARRICIYEDQGHDFFSCQEYLSLRDSPIFAGVNLVVYHPHCRMYTVAVYLFNPID